MSYYLKKILAEKNGNIKSFSLGTENEGNAIFTASFFNLETFMISINSERYKLGIVYYRKNY